MSDDWINVYHPVEEGAPRLVCLAYVGGASTAFLGLARRLAPRVEVLAVQYPGRQNRRLEPPIPDIRALADAVHGALEAYPGPPLVVFGHSMGALVAYELVQRLEREGDPRLAGFVASGRRGPSTPLRVPTPQTDDEILADMRRLGGADERVLREPELVEMILPASRADWRAVDGYQPDPGSAVHCPTLVCVGDADPDVTLDEARAWERHVDGAPFELREFPGGHFYLAQPEAEAQLADLLAERVTAWAAARRSP